MSIENKVNTDMFKKKKKIVLNIFLQCYGAGNIPSNRKDMVDIISEGTKRYPLFTANFKSLNLLEPGESSSYVSLSAVMVACRRSMKQDRS